MTIYKINTLLLLAGGPHGITLADTPSRLVTFAGRTMDTINDDGNNSRDITYEVADIHDNGTSDHSTTYVEMGVEQVSVHNVCIDKDKQPFKMYESDKAKNECFHQEVCNKLTRFFYRSVLCESP